MFPAIHLEINKLRVTLFDCKIFFCIDNMGSSRVVRYTLSLKQKPKQKRNTFLGGSNPPSLRLF